MKKWLERSKMSKYIEKVNIVRVFWSFSISFWYLLINFNLFSMIWTQFNQFCCDELKSGFRFGLKKSIKSWFDHNISWLVNLDRLDCLSLVKYRQYNQFIKLFHKICPSFCYLRPNKFKINNHFEHGFMSD